MQLSPSLDLDNEYFRIEHVSGARDGRKAIAEFSAGDEAKGLECVPKLAAAGLRRDGREGF